jgi:hypothetical protein
VNYNKVLVEQVLVAQVAMLVEIATVVVAIATVVAVAVVVIATAMIAAVATIATATITTAVDTGMIATFAMKITAMVAEEDHALTVVKMDIVVVILAAELFSAKVEAILTSSNAAMMVLVPHSSRMQTLTTTILGQPAGVIVVL